MDDPARKVTGAPPRPNDDEADKKGDQGYCSSNHHRDSVATNTASGEIKERESSQASTNSSLVCSKTRNRDIVDSHSHIGSGASSMKSNSQPQSILTPDLTPSGHRTPAACQPLTRRRVSQESQTRPAPTWSKSDSSLTTSGRRSRSHDTMKRLTELRENLLEPNSNFSPASPEMLGSQPQPFLRPPRPPRRVSEKVLQETNDLRSELEDMRQCLSDQEATRQRELLMVNFAMNRILQVQKNQMDVQMRLVDRFNAMEIQPGHVGGGGGLSDRGAQHGSRRGRQGSRRRGQGGDVAADKDGGNGANDTDTRSSKRDCKQQ